MNINLHTLLASPNQQYLFIGYITNNILDAIAAGIEEVIAIQPEMASRYRYVFSIYVEMLQNILFYSDQRLEIASGGDAAFGGIEIALDDDLVSISAVNPISVRQYSKLEAIMAEIAALSAEEVARSYKQKMMDSFEDSESRGGGLGYYEIARKSVRPMRYGFFEDGQGGYLFRLSAWV
jgi:hypothetical protein